MKDGLVNEGQRMREYDMIRLECEIEKIALSITVEYKG